MTTADRLLEQMFSWIDQRSRCADQLVKLARELESLRHDCKGGERAPVISDGFILVIEVLLGTTYLGAGAVISVATKLVEHFLSSSTMKDAKDIEEKSNKLAEDIQRLFEKLKSEIKEANRFADPDDLDRHILMDIMRAVARRSGVKVNINFRSIADEPNWSTGGGVHNTRFSPGLNLPILVSVTGVLAFFTLKSIGTKSTFLFDIGAQQLITKISVTGMKTVLKGGGMLVGGAIGKAFALNEAIDSWTDLIKNNNVTEASQSLRDTAKAIRKISKALRDQFKDMKQMLEEMEEEQCEQAKVKRIIENPNRSPEEERELLRYAIETCQIKEVQQWWNENQGMETFINLVELFRLMKNEIINKSNEDKTNYFGWEVDIIFLAHGFITQPTIPAFCLRPWSNIQDVLLYSPGNVSSGLMQPTASLQDSCSLGTEDLSVLQELAVKIVMKDIGPGNCRWSGTQ